LHGGAANGEAANKAEEHERVPVGGEGASQRGDEVEDGQAAQAIAAPVEIARDAGRQCSDNRSPEGNGDGEAEAPGRELESVGQRAGGTGDHGGVEAEEQAAECGNHSAFDEGGIQRHASSPARGAPMRALGLR